MASPLIRFSVGCRGDFFNSFNDFQAAILVDLADDNEFFGCSSNSISLAV